MKAWFITGAGRGLGAQIAQAALVAGHQVVATGRNAAAVRAALGPQERLLVLALDVTNESQARAAARRALKEFGRIDVLVNNAGYGLLGGVEEATGDEVEAVFRTNVFGTLNVIRAVLPSMRARREGHIVNLSSIGGYSASVGWGVYGATKFAIEGISESLGKELDHLGVHVTVVEPGYFRTGFLGGDSLRRAAASISDYSPSVGRMRTFAQSANGQQPGDPERLAQVLVDIGGSPKPPRRLALGSDTVRAIRAKNAAVELELAQWLDVSTSTDFVPAEA